MRAMRHLIPAGLLILAGAWLLSDGILFTIYPADHATGREAGCFTQLELWCRVLQPTWLRTIELIGAITFVPLGMLKLFEFFAARRQEQPFYK